jgi:hypothetical protein
VCALCPSYVGNTAIISQKGTLVTEHWMASFPARILVGAQEADSSDFYTTDPARKPPGSLSGLLLPPQQVAEEVSEPLWLLAAPAWQIQSPSWLGSLERIGTRV